MALFVQCPDGRLARDLWGFPEAILAEDTLSTICPFPTDYESVCGMLSVSSLNYDTRDNASGQILMPSAQGTWVPAILRLQGYLKQSRVGLYGDWDGQPRSCISAMNSILIEPGSSTFSSIWKSSWEVIQHYSSLIGTINPAQELLAVRITYSIKLSNESSTNGCMMRKHCWALGISMVELHERMQPSFKKEIS
ncbi:hypothetical protein CALVIDRAFT_530344 [Calocera viscosa TUFC12733]|uniref:Uncharacterized protein n=1 Tax=Calocera viscosa (strain TUFC12733) TaxID=1330018 RepID=A0A167I216_CALVF|nr:hypothetical protein CALVIDRAFT_530344 [Calocera viscosa TUFC12733]